MGRLDLRDPHRDEDLKPFAKAEKTLSGKLVGKRVDRLRIDETGSVLITASGLGGTVVVKIG